ncbi:unnamed protein product, partial [Urochloa humidicola]
GRAPTISAGRIHAPAGVHEVPAERRRPPSPAGMIHRPAGTIDGGFPGGQIREPWWRAWRHGELRRGAWAACAPVGVARCCGRTPAAAMGRLIRGRGEDPGGSGVPVWRDSVLGHGSFHAGGVGAVRAPSPRQRRSGE